MKTIILPILAMCMSFSVYSQNAKLVKGVPASVKAKPIKVQPVSISIDNEVPYSLEMQLNASSVDTRMHSVSTFTEATIGNTRYDLQSNRSTGKRITNNGDGTLSAVWNFTPDGGTNGVDRGTGYNYFDGTNWGPAPTARLEPIRTGFTNIDYSLGGGEFVCAHTGVHGMLRTHRATKGLGPWDTTTVGSFNLLTNQADVWSRMAVGGPNGNTMHVIVNSQGTGTTPVLNQSGPLTYSRSLDGGLTWVDDHIQIPGTDASFMYGVGAEEYHIDARGNIVAVVTGGFTNDVVLFKSLDDGATWTRTVVLPFPLGQPYDQTTMNTDTTGDGIGEIIETNAGDVTVTIDNNNLCHVAFGHMFIYQDSGDFRESLFPDDNTGLYYWNEGMITPIIIAAAEDFNGNSFIDIPSPLDTVNDVGYGFYNIGFIGQPSIGFDASNNVYIAYSAIDERADTTKWTKAMRHIFLITSFDGGSTWSSSYTLNPNPDGFYIEAVWPSIATLVDNCVHVVYQRDSVPDTSITEVPPGGPFQGPNAFNPSNIIYVCVPVSELTSLNQNIRPNNEWISDNYPNPVKDFTTINVSLTETSDVTLEITNTIGQLKYSTKQNALAAGSHSIKIDVSHLDAGIYFYTVSAVDKKVSKKMVVE